MNFELLKEIGNEITKLKLKIWTHHGVSHKQEH